MTGMYRYKIYSCERPIPAQPAAAISMRICSEHLYSVRPHIIFYFSRLAKLIETSSIFLVWIALCRHTACYNCTVVRMMLQ